MNHNSIIDYTLLDNSATENEIIALCEKAIALKVKTVCVMPQHVKIAKNHLLNSSVLVCSVVSFPEGTNSIIDKVDEMKLLLRDGADEIDVVWNYHKISDLAYLSDELKALVMCKNEHVSVKGTLPVLKIIVESGLLTLEQTKKATELCIENEVDFIKTSTGKVTIGAERNKVEVMRQTIGAHPLKIKASGGIRTLVQLNEFLSFVDRFGIGFASVDEMNGIESKNANSY